MKRIKIVLTDDHAVLRAGLRLLINAQSDMEVVAEAADGDEAVRAVERTAPDVVLMDLTMPGLSAVQAIERIRREHPRTRVLVLSMHDDPAYARVVLAAGASGHVVKDVDGAELLSGIRAVSRGRTFVDLGPGARLEDVLTPPTPVAPSKSRSLLSPREWQVLELVAHGHTSQEVARRLALSVKTVETYRTRFGDKLGLHSRADLVRFAMEIGLMSQRRAPGRAE